VIWKTEDDKKQDWIKVEVQEISNTVVTLRETTHFNNGTDKVATISHDVETRSVGLYMIAANLSDGDRIFVSGMALGNPSFYRLNYTASRSYDGASRLVNVLSLVVITRFFMHPFNLTEEAYWDKTTGFLVEHKQEGFIPQNKNSTLGVWLMRIAETSLWEMPVEARSYWSQFLPLITIGMITAVVVSSVLIEWRRKNKGLEAREK